MKSNAQARFAAYQAAPPVTLRRILFQGLAKSLSKQTEEFQDIVLNLLTTNLPIKATSFYAYHPEQHYLVLLKQKGFAYADYDSFELSPPSLAAETARAKK